MELYGEEIVLFENSGEATSMLADRGFFGAASWGGKRVSEIKVVLRAEAVEQASGPQRLDGVPAHVWELHDFRQARDTAGQQSKAHAAGGLFTRFIQRLQTKADAQKCCAVVYSAEDRLAEGMLIESADESSAMTDSRQYQTTRRCDLHSVVCCVDLRAQPAERSLDGRDVTGPVVDECHLHRSSLVLGKTRRSRRSRDTAKRKARANAL